MQSVEHVAEDEFIINSSPLDQLLYFTSKGEAASDLDKFDMARVPGIKGWF